MSANADEGNFLAYSFVKSTKIASDIYAPAT